MNNGIAKPKGFTLVELLVTGVVAVIVILGVGAVLVDNHRGWLAMYSRVHSDVVTDGHVARRMFDAYVRKSRTKNILLDDTSSSLELHYYSDFVPRTPDRYARFYLSGDQLKVEYGIWNPADPKVPLGGQTVCANVSSCRFTREEASVQMVLKLDNGSHTATITSSALTHN